MPTSLTPSPPISPAASGFALCTRQHLRHLNTQPWFSLCAHSFTVPFSPLRPEPSPNFAWALWYKYFQCRCPLSLKPYSICFDLHYNRTSNIFELHLKLFPNLDPTLILYPSSDPTFIPNPIIMTILIIIRFLFLKLNFIVILIPARPKKSHKIVPRISLLSKTVVPPPDQPTAPANAVSRSDPVELVRRSWTVWRLYVSCYHRLRTSESPLRRYPHFFVLHQDAFAHTYILRHTPA